MTIKIEGIAHDADPVSIEFAEHRQSGSVHTIQLTLRNAAGVIEAPAAGTVTIKVRSPGGGAFESVEGSAVDVTDRANWTQTLKQHVEALELTPGSVTADYTIGVAISSSFGGA